MAMNKGTIVSAPIRPATTEDTIAVAVAEEIKGGYHVYSTAADMYAIPENRRTVGMRVFVVDTSTLYTLENNPAGNTTTSKDWKEIAVKSSNVILSDQKKTLQQKLDEMDKLNSKYLYIIVADPVKGVNDVEITLPFKGTVEEITSSCETSMTLDSDITFDMEKLDASSADWEKFKSLSITAKSTNMNTISVNTVCEAMTRFRVNVINLSAKIKTLQVILKITPYVAPVVAETTTTETEKPVTEN